MRQRIAMLLLGCLCFAGLSAPAVAQEVQNGLVVNVYVDNLFESGLVDRWINAAGEGDAAELRMLIDRYQSIVGLDPTKDIRSIQVSSSAGLMEMAEGNPESLIPKTVLLADVAKTGNLEGLLVAAPGYKASQDRAGNSLHHFDVEEIAGVVAFVPASSGRHYIVVGCDEGMTRKAIDAVSTRKASDTASSASTGGEDRLIDFHISNSALKELTDSLAGQGDEYETAIIRNVLGLLDSIDVSVSAGDANALKLTLALEAKNESAARQLEQLANAGKGALDMVIQSEGANDKEVIQMKQLVDSVKLSTEGTTVTATASVSETTLMMLMLQ